MYEKKVGGDIEGERKGGEREKIKKWRTDPVFLH